jgi:hypothetical protein
VAGPTGANSARSGEANFAAARRWAGSPRTIVADGSEDANPTRVANARRGVAATEKRSKKHSKTRLKCTKKHRKMHEVENHRSK